MQILWIFTRNCFLQGKQYHCYHRLSGRQKFFFFFIWLRIEKQFFDVNFTWTSNTKLSSSLSATEWHAQYIFFSSPAWNGSWCVIFFCHVQLLKYKGSVSKMKCCLIILTCLCHLRCLSLNLLFLVFFIRWDGNILSVLSSPLLCLGVWLLFLPDCQLHRQHQSQLLFSSLLVTARELFTADCVVPLKFLFVTPIWSARHSFMVNDCQRNLIIWFAASRVEAKVISQFREIWQDFSMETEQNLSKYFFTWQSHVSLQR